MDESTRGVAGLRLEWGEDGRSLQAVFTPTEPGEPIDAAGLRSILADQGFTGLFLFDHALADLTEQINAPSSPFSLVIGERRDGEATVTVAPDKMSAYLTISRPFGGRPVDRPQVLEALAKSGVVGGILEQQIDEAVALGSCDGRLIAQGKPAAAGTDATFRSLVAEIRERKPHLDEHGVADYRDLAQIVTVKAGDPLMRRIPPAPGVPGETVMGEPIPAKPGKETRFAPGLKGAAVASDDDSLLIAAVAGQPVLVPNGVMVEPTLSVPNVDLSTGHLSFEGSVKIAADVKTGMKVRATGDVIVCGTVEAAEIEAGGDVTVKGGIIGQTDAKGHGGTHPGSARIRSGGSVSALFIEHAVIEAGNCIAVEEAVKQSELTAINQVVVGKDGSRKGHIIGGVTRATLLVQAAVAGSPAGIGTWIEVGVNPLIHGRLDAADRRIQGLEKEKEELVRVLAYGKSNPQRIKPELLQKAERTCEKLILDIAEASREKEALQAQLDLADNARIVVGQKAYGGVHIRIGQKVLNNEDERGGGTFRLEEDEISFSGPSTAVRP
jgi:uncharacterized protein (DUF342 family)